MREFIVGCLILVAVVASRHASINYPDELSADESELLVQIDRYEHDMMPWRSVDGSTIGPINPWFLLLIKQAGWPMSYSGLHFLAAVLLGLTAVISYYTIRLFLPCFAACLVGLACVLAPTCALSVYHYRAGEPLRNHLVAMQRDADRNLPAVVTREILRVAPGASTMVVWGWMPTLYVKSRLHSATRHTISHFLIDPGPSREFIREQFLREVHSARPDVIVDAVASDCFTWYWPIESSGIESFPEFAAYVKANYTLALSVMADQTGVPLRVFVRKPTDDSRL